ncbi:MAG: hypothetical protein WC100_00760 [Sterolibacterium sp.]
MKNNQATLTMDVGGAQLTVETQALFRAWMEKHLSGNTSSADPLNRPPLRYGERYVGAILGKDGHGHHVIRLPYERDKQLNWKDAMAYAAQEGAELPDRVESALLYAKREPDEYVAEYHWTREQDAGNESYAWLQSFLNGGQTIIHKDVKYRVVLVRRVAI